MQIQFQNSKWNMGPDRIPYNVWIGRLFVIFKAVGVLVVDGNVSLWGAIDRVNGVVDHENADKQEYPGATVQETARNGVAPHNVRSERFLTMRDNAGGRRVVVFGSQGHQLDLFSWIIACSERRHLSTNKFFRNYC